MATALEIATRVRNLISERSPAATNVTIPHIQALIPTALEVWARDAITDPEKRSALEKEQTVAAASGVVNLAAYFDGTTAKVSPSDLRAQQIYMEGITGGPAGTWVSSKSQLMYGRYPSHVPALFLDGNNLRIRNTDGSLTSYTGNIRFNAATLPSTATDIPSELVGDFILFLAKLATQEKLVDLR